MKKYLQMDNISRHKVSGWVILTVIVLFSCSKVDNHLGESFIPDDQKMKVGMDTLYGIKTYLTKSDSFPTSGMTFVFMGSSVNPTFGHTQASFCSQYILNYFSSGPAMFGIAPVFDSLELYFTVNGAFLGDTSRKQKFNVYKLAGDLHPDTVYYADFDPLKVADSEVLYSFELQGIPSKGVTLKMDTPEAIAFGHQLMDTSGRAYTSDSLFHKKFKGLYIAPAQAAGTDPSACVYRLAIDGIEMALYTRCFTDQSATKVKDTVKTYYAFGKSVYKNAHLSSLSHNYQGTPIQGKINDTLPGSTPTEYGYVQTLGGVATYVRLSDELIEDLRAHIVPPFKNMVINKARIIWPMEPYTPEDLTRAPSRLGAYSKYRKFTGILDYNTAAESSGTTLMYDGYLNRTFGHYGTDITMFLQKLIGKQDTTSYHTFTLGPGGNLLADFNQVILKTGINNPPLRIAITYTLLR